MNAAQIALSRKTGPGGRDIVALVSTLTMVAGANVVGSLNLPAGSILKSIDVENGTAFTGAPTNINFRAGTATDGSGVDVIADTDIKAAGHFRPSLVAAFNAVLAAATPIYFRLAATGGTSPAGAATVIITFCPPAP